MNDQLRERVAEAIADKVGYDPVDVEAADAAIPVVLAWLREQVGGERLADPTTNTMYGYNAAIDDVLALLDLSGRAE